jgi:putative flippase GtrA
MRYAAVSAIGVAATQVLLLGALDLGWSGVAANASAVSIVSVPAYLLNRHWVWGRDGRHDVAREVLPFWGMALLGLVVSTTLVAVVSHDGTASPLVVSAANLSGFAALWVIRYVVLDRVLFASA